MKRLVITLSIIAVLGMIFSGLPSFAQPTQIPHENPSTATALLDKVALLLSYSQIVNLAASQQYQDAQDALNELRHTDFPDELRYIIDRYRNLCQQLFNTLDNLESLLDEASVLLDQRQIHEAKQKLDNAQADIQNASTLLEDIEAATDTLSHRLGISASPAGSQIKQAHARLEESAQRLKELIDKLKNLWQSLTGRYVQMTGLIPTKLNLSVTPASIFVGDSITAAGSLSGDGIALAKRKLVLTLDNKPIATTTNIDGSYVTNITIPYEYVTTMTLTAVYQPIGDDIDKYLASKSPPVTINTVFHPTLLEVSAPEMAHPGLPFTISGRVSSTNSNIDRTVSMLLDDTRLARETTPGQFSMEVITPEQMATGQHKLTVSVTSHGRHAGTSATRNINISKLPIHVDAQTPKITILPNNIQISGQVYDNLRPIPNASVGMKFKDSTSTVRTSPDGSFTTAIRTPLDLPPFDRKELMMTVTPAEPWYATTEVKRQLFTINPLSMELIMAALLALWILVDMLSRIRRREETVIPRAEVIELPTTPLTPKPKPKLTGIKGRILSAYQDGLEAVEKLSGVGMAPNTTLREFLNMATVPSPTAIQQFAELTAIAESALYSAYSLREDTATSAEQLAATIKEELRSGTS